MSIFNTTEKTVTYEVVRDEDTSDPVIESDTGVSLWSYRGGYPSTISGSTPNRETDAYKRFYELWDDEKALEATRRYLKIFTDFTGEVALYQHRGHSQGDWLDVFIVVPEEGYGTAEGWGEEWSQWANGDVYGVTRQVRDEDDEIIEEDDGLWGITVDSELDAAKYVAEQYYQETITGER